MRQIFGEVRWEAKAAVFLGLVAIFSIVGPFGSYETMTMAERFTYWTVIMIGIGFFMHIFMTLALRSPHLAKWPGAAKIAIGSLVAAIPGAAIVEFANEVFRPTGIHLTTILRTWMQVSVIGVIVGIVEYLDWRPQNTKPSPVRTPIHKRLSAELGQDIVSMSMQDHYVEITTTQGKDLILMRFSDALHEVADLPGFQLHRSHWAATAHAAGVVRKGGKSKLQLSDGRELPISATYLENVQKSIPAQN